MDDVDIKLLEAKRNEITKQIDDYYKKEAKEKIEQNKFYIGCCLKRIIDNKIYYYKIIDIDLRNEYRMYVFYFTEFSTDYSKIISQDLCSINSIGFFTNTLNDELKPCKELDLYDEISKEEYEEALNKWIQNIYKI